MSGRKEAAPKITSRPTTDQAGSEGREQQQKRVSAFSFSDLPEVVPAETYQDKEFVPAAAHQDKEVVHDDHKETAIEPGKETAHLEHLPQALNREHGKESVPVATESSPIKKRLNSRVCGIRAKWMLLCLALLILLAIVLGIGLGIGLRSG